MTETSPRDVQESPVMKQASQKEIPRNFLLNLTIKRGTISGGGLANIAYVETSIDGQVVDRSEDTQPNHEKVEFNREIKEKEVFLYTPNARETSAATGESASVTTSPTTSTAGGKEATPPAATSPPGSSPRPVSLRNKSSEIEFGVYKKRWTSPGYKLVGRVRIPVAQVLSESNRGPSEVEFQLWPNKRNVTLSGSLTLLMEIVPRSAAENETLTEKEKEEQERIEREKEEERKKNEHSGNVPKTPAELAKAVFRAVFKIAQDILQKFLAANFEEQVLIVLLAVVMMLLWLNFREMLMAISTTTKTS